MVLDLSDVDFTVKAMDEQYDANFGSWIRNERNAAVVGFHLHKYLEDYKICDVIIVVKWIVRSWTLRSIIIFTKAMVLEDLKRMTNKKRSETYKQFIIRNTITSGLIHTWNNLFIIEFINSMIKEMNNTERIRFISNVLTYFESERISEIITLANKKFGSGAENVLLRIVEKRKNKNYLTMKKLSKDVRYAFSIS